MHPWLWIFYLILTIFDKESRLLHISNMTKITFCIIFTSLILLEFSLKKVEFEEKNLLNQLNGLKIKIEESRALQKYLTRQINSQSDPSWIEMVLKKELGMVPEDQIKIYFLK